MGRGALRPASLLGVVLATAGISSAPSTAEAPGLGWRAMADRGRHTGVETFQDIHFAVCPCWPTTLDLVDEIHYFHSDFSFTCFLSVGLRSVEVSAHSSGAGGPFQSEVFTPQPRSRTSTRCSHVQARPRIHVSSREELKTDRERAACVAIVTDAAARLGCKD